VDSNVYLYVDSPGTVIQTATFRTTGSNSGELELTPKPPAQLGMGVFTEAVTVRACLDAGCGRQIGGSPQTIRVTYAIAGVTASTNAVNFSSVENIVSAPSLPVTIASGSSWTSTITYGGGASGWLTLNPSSATTRSTPVTFTASALSIGTYNATIVFTSGPATISVSVTNTVVKNLNVGATAAAFTAVAGQPSMPAAFTPSVTSAGGTTAYGATISYGPGANNWLSVTGASAPGVLSIVPTTTSLPPGATYTAQIVLTPTIGTTVTIPVSYTLSAARLAVNPAAIVFDINAASTSADTYIRRQATTSDSGAQVSWSAVSSVPWLTVSPSGNSGSAATLALVPAQLTAMQNGAASATVTFTYSGPGFTNATVTLPVTLNLSLPTVHYVAPYVAYVNEQKPIIVRGSGFAQLGGNSLTFNGVPVAATVISDTELRLTPPAFANPVRVVASVANALGLNRNTAELVVRNHPNYSYFALAIGDAGPFNQHATYDAERDAVFASAHYLSYNQANPNAASYVSRYAYNSANATWALTTKYFDQLSDTAMSTDGRYLLVMTMSKLHIADPVTMDIIRSVDLPTLANGVDQQLAVMNDGTVIIQGAQSAYSLVTDSLSPWNQPNQQYLNVTGISSASLDGSRAVIATQSSPPQLFYYHDASTNSIVSTSVQQNVDAGRLNRDGTKYLAGTGLFDGNFAFLGSIYPSGGPYSFTKSISPDGTRAYTYTDLPPRVHTLDTSIAQDPLVLISSLDLVDDPVAPVTLVGLDGKALFLVGRNRFVVLPLP
jgi:hypothetical protein